MMDDFSCVILWIYRLRHNHLLIVYTKSKYQSKVTDFQDWPEAGTIKFILPEFVSYLGERGVMCVGNG